MAFQEIVMIEFEIVIESMLRGATTEMRKVLVSLRIGLPSSVT